jgi:AcrR family transcriptional regulator
VRSVSRQEAPGFVCDLLEKRAVLGREDLSARSVAKALGQTTGFLYHHWGSFDAFLFEVSGLGWQRLVDGLLRAWQKHEEARDVLHAYVEFAAEHPVLYWLLAERPLAPDITRATLEGGTALPSFKAWQAVLALISRAEPTITLAGARAVHAAVHGVASQLLSHRLGSMPDALTAGERAIARDITDAIADRYFTPRPPSRRSPARGPKADSPPRPRTTRRASSSRSASRKPKSGT